MYDTPKNTIEFRVWGRYAMFTDPLTRVGGEKCSYHLPTYEALKGIAKSIYWKPTFIWHIDQVRVMKRIHTQTKGMKPLNFGGVYPSKRDLSKKEEPPNTLAIYTYLTGDPDLVTKEPSVEYQVRAHFEWNQHRPELKKDRNDGKHFEIAKRSLERGGRQDIFLGTRDCQGYVEPCVFGDGDGTYDNAGDVQYSLMFHSFDYPDETGKHQLVRNLWRPKLVNGILAFPRPDDLTQVLKNEIRPMGVKPFGVDKSVRSAEAEWQEYVASNGGAI